VNVPLAIPAFGNAAREGNASAVAVSIGKSSSACQITPPHLLKILTLRESRYEMRIGIKE
jgi:hypothetical protein